MASPIQPRRARRAVIGESLSTRRRDPLYFSVLSGPSFLAQVDRLSGLVGSRITIHGSRGSGAPRPVTVRPAPSKCADAPPSVQGFILPVTHPASIAQPIQAIGS